jgi:hypothetical protein
MGGQSMLVLKVLWLLIIYDCLEKFGGMRRVHAAVKGRKLENSITTIAVDDLVKVVDRARIWYPKQVLCLQRSFALTCLLRRFGHPAVFVLGASRIPFRAHAWVEIAGCPIHEKPNVKESYLVWERC